MRNSGNPLILYRNWDIQRTVRIRHYFRRVKPTRNIIADSPTTWDWFYGLFPIQDFPNWPRQSYHFDGFINVFPNAEFLSFLLWDSGCIRCRGWSAYRAWFWVSPVTTCHLSFWALSYRWWWGRIVQGQPWSAPVPPCCPFQWLLHSPDPQASSSPF